MAWQLSKGACGKGCSHGNGLRNNDSKVGLNL